MNKTVPRYHTDLEGIFFSFVLPVWGQSVDDVHKSYTKAQRDGQDGTDWEKNRTKCLYNRKLSYVSGRVSIKKRSYY